jgi:hypothetical protein
MTVQATRRLSRAEAFAQLPLHPEIASNVSAAARLWGCSLSTARAWLAEFASPPLATPQSPPIAMATPEAPPAPPPTTTLTDTAPPAHNRNGVALFTVAAALSLAAVSACFSVTGLTSIFAGAFWAVVAMGVAFEAGKLSAVAWLGQHHDGRLRVALIVLVAVLMAFNAIGTYGFLAKAHIAHAVAGEVHSLASTADVEARLSVQAGVVVDLDRRITQIDTAVEKATERGRSTSAMRLADEQRRNRLELTAERVREGKALATLQVEKATVDGGRRQVEADLGPVRYLAILLGADAESVLRYFILAVALLLDPAAVLLLLAASARAGR